ncbi:hypothetical protein SASPL_148805 [Salvia splendens]|uniref:Uncharacterized protein n=1 Tax=Salvia splendens TaxID=180675 RepID=A0A8X8WA08_SALSN|nr:hypothetical protein SASPL_148805 [Salvia splendens]
MRFRFKQPLPLSLLRPPQPASASSFGVAFDIDGVILHGANPIGNSRRALRKFYNDSGSLKIPLLFLTNGRYSKSSYVSFCASIWNLTACLCEEKQDSLLLYRKQVKYHPLIVGGGIPESRRALELSDILGVKILPSQVVQGHSPFSTLLKRYENEFIVATGKGEPAVVMSEYGFKRVVSLDEYASHFSNIDPVAQYKRLILSTGVGNRDIQVLCDILTSGGIPGQKNWHQPPLYFAADDLQYQAAFPSERLGMGAFRIALESVFNRYLNIFYNSNLAILNTPKSMDLQSTKFRRDFVLNCIVNCDGFSSTDND